MEKLSDAKCLESEELETHVPAFAKVQETSERVDQLEIQPAGMVWATIMCLGAFQEIYMKYIETSEYARNNPSDRFGQAIYALRTFGLVFVIYFLLRVLIERKHLTGKLVSRQFWPCFLHSLVICPYYIHTLIYLPVNRAEQLNILMQWAIEFSSSLIIFVVYRTEDASESPLLIMKPYVFKQSIAAKED